MGNGTVVTVSLDPKRVQEIERAGGRGASVRPETEQPTYPLPGAFAQQPMATQQMQPPVGQMQHPGMLPTQEPQATSMSMPPNMPETVPLADQDAAAMQQATGAPGGQQMGYQPYQQGYPYQQMPPLGMLAVPAAVPAGISAAVPADAAAAVQPLGPADASAALPTVASKFSTANATDAEFSTTSSSNDVS